ncbi:LysR family transcriptional regulator [Paracoccus sulfuroxidans]|uniref:DNA-binding transcriptional LysR family regulator n=1 Tax=Paracoccus sulfuroxidans TaxID=384678 RepID=A0A562NGC2_9RHOB|nr:LysR family transcriptional regulator [Paracoccus sulfuroxidans]TWI31187.1 DNA-binding transcriptional LysR family regulator [Paracoccus sulfuroxidans]
MLDHFGDVLAFVRVADTASFTKAADGLGMTRSAVGKCITRLEEGLNTRLVHRTTRSVSLTEEGRLFYDHALRILDEVEDAEAMLDERRYEPKGRLRIDLPVAFGRIHVMPVVRRFLAQWPDLEADVTFSDDYRDLVCEGIDIAIRIGGPTESGLIRRVLAPHRFVICAAPEYLERKGVPRTLEDLQHHDKVVFTQVNCGVPWRVRIGATPRDVEVRGTLRLSNSEAIRDAALAGFGLVQLGAFLVGEDIRHGRLIPVLEQFAAEQPPICAVYPTRRHVSPKVRRFVEMLCAEWSGERPWG